MTVARWREGSGYSPQSLFCLFCLQSVSLPAYSFTSRAEDRTHSLLTTHHSPDYWASMLGWGPEQASGFGFSSMGKESSLGPSKACPYNPSLPGPYTLHSPLHTIHTHSLLSRSCTGQSWPSDSATRRGSPCTISLSFFLSQVALDLLLEVRGLTFQSQLSQ